MPKGVANKFAPNCILLSQKLSSLTSACRRDGMGAIGGDRIYIFVDGFVKIAWVDHSTGRGWGSKPRIPWPATLLSDEIRTLDPCLEMLVT